MKKKIQLRFGVFLMSVVSIIAGEEPELPLCPTNIQYFPQNLPMHCRMPPQSQQMQFMFQNPPGKEGQLIPIPIPPFPGAPGQMPAPGPPPGIGIGSIPPFPGPFPGPMPGPLPGMPGALPGPFPGLPVPPPGPVPMPMPVPGGPPHKLPVIVMPFYSPDGSYKKRITTKPPKKKKKHRDSSYSSDDADSGSSDSSDERGWWKPDRKKRKKKYYDMYRRFNKVRNAKLKRRTNGERLLTPVLQYVTKDGYVIFEKQISNGEAKDWLRTNDRKDVKDRKEDKITENNKPKQETPRQLPHKEENMSTMEDSEETQGYEKMTKSPEGVKEFTFRRRPPKKRHIQ